MCAKLYSLVQDLTGQLKDLISQKVYDPRGESVLAIVYSYSDRNSCNDQKKNYSMSRCVVGQRYF